MKIAAGQTYKDNDGVSVYIMGPANWGLIDGCRVFWALHGDWYLEDGRMVVWPRRAYRSRETNWVPGDSRYSLVELVETPSYRLGVAEAWAARQGEATPPT